MNSIAENTKSDNEKQPKAAPDYTPRGPLATALNFGFSLSERQLDALSQKAEQDSRALTYLTAQTFLSELQVYYTRGKGVVKQDGTFTVELSGPERFGRLVDTISWDLDEAQAIALRTCIVYLDQGDMISKATNGGNLTGKDAAERWNTMPFPKSCIVLKAGNIDDYQIAELQKWFELAGYKQVKAQTIGTAINSLAHDKSTNKFMRGYMKAIEIGKDRPEIFHDLMVNKLRAKDEPYSIFWLKSLMSETLQRWRALVPVQEYSKPMAHRYLMTGPQGIGKSFITERLSFGSVYDLTDEDITSKDNAKRLAGSAFVNLDDQGAQTKRRTNQIKHAITAPTIKVREPYAKTDTTYPSRAVWVGSTNDLSIYTDNTGFRREMPIEFGLNMTNEEATRAGNVWVNDLLKNDPNYFYDLYCTFFNEVSHDHYNDGVGFDWSFYSIEKHEDMQERRAELVGNHRKVSDIEDEIFKALATAVGPSFNPLDGATFRTLTTGTPGQHDTVVDPFTAQTSSKRLSEFDTLDLYGLNDYIKARCKESGAKVTNSRIHDMLAELELFYETKQDGQKVYKRYELKK